MALAAIIEGATDGEIAGWIGERLAAALGRARGPVAIALPGGTTPFPILAAMAALPLDWGRLLVVPTDDRLVDEAHPASNVGRLRAVLAPLGAQVTSLGHGDGAQLLPAPFALAWLGMGADGHVASLFPGNDPRADDPQRIRRLMPEPLPPEAPFERITLTLPALVDSDEMVIVARGEAKRRVIEAAISGASDLPVARLFLARAARALGPVTCFT